jgi:hypothetical protein
VAWATADYARSNAQIAVILGTERIGDDGLVMTALVLS